MTCCLQDVENKYDQNMKSNKVLEGDYFEWLSLISLVLTGCCLSGAKVKGK